jgi:hypothetical protein
MILDEPEGWLNYLNANTCGRPGIDKHGAPRNKITFVRNTLKSKGDFFRYHNSISEGLCVLSCHLLQLSNRAFGRDVQAAQNRRVRGDILNWRCVAASNTSCAALTCR